jgi:hypothetical protein
MTIPVLLTIKQFSEKHAAFPLGGLRWRIFKAKEEMDAAGVIVRNGRRVLINEERFFSWLESQGGRVA